MNPYCKKAVEKEKERILIEIDNRSEEINNTLKELLVAIKAIIKGIPDLIIIAIINLHQYIYHYIKKWREGKNAV